MIPNLSNVIYYLESDPNILMGIRRGIERESLRINFRGEISQKAHPKIFGSPLFHKWITTDFSESLIEIITPVNSNISYTFSFLHDIHLYIYKNLDNELLWPMSMPCSIKSSKLIKIANYGNSKIGRMKTLYRIGLKNRYGSNMQIISGIHYNFSLPLKFWNNNKIFDFKNNSKIVSEGYLRLIRNYYKFGWIIPYFFGASPGICESFIKNKKVNLPLKKTSSGLLYLPYATSLRLSDDLGYNNKYVNQFKIVSNSFKDYIKYVKYALNTPIKEYKNMKLFKNNKFLQLNNNILQTENELYSFIRPKRVLKNNESLLQALSRDGIEYVEIRSLDINPFSPIGLNIEQIYFLDLFLIWCALIKTIKLNDEDIANIKFNWNKVILEGRKPGLSIKINRNNKLQPIIKIGKILINDLKKIAIILDKFNNSKFYQNTCDNLLFKLNYPELTVSSRILKKLIKYGINKTGLTLANRHYNFFKERSFNLIKEEQFMMENNFSLRKQKFHELSNF